MRAYPLSEAAILLYNLTFIPFWWEGRLLLTSRLPSSLKMPCIWEVNLGFVVPKTMLDNVCLGSGIHSSAADARDNRHRLFFSVPMKIHPGYSQYMNSCTFNLGFSRVTDHASWSVDLYSCMSIHTFKCTCVVLMNSTASEYGGIGLGAEVSNLSEGEDPFVMSPPKKIRDPPLP